MKKLNIIATIKDGFALALVNYVSLILVFVLYILTIWIPYLNVGTTIAMCSIPAELAKGAVINPLFIFNSKYRKNMGEFFILMALETGAIWVGLLFGIIPGLVISVAWSFANVLFVDKDLSALDALRESNRITYGNKWRLFWTEFLVVFAMEVACGIISGLFSIGHVGALETIGAIIVVIIAICIVPTLFGVEASIYKQLTTGEFVGEEPVAPAPAPEPAPAPAPAPEAPKAEEPKAAKAPKAPKAE